MTTNLHLIYIHGFDNTGNSVKGKATHDYCQIHHPYIQVHTPNLNMKPDEVINTMTTMITDLSKSAPVVLIGSSLGGYFSTILSNITGVPAFLLNPSTKPHVTLTRFYPLEDEDKLDDTVFFTTAGGWKVTYGDMRWVEAHTFANQMGEGVTHPEKIGMLLTTGDEVLPYEIAKAFYGSQDNGKGISKIHIAEGDDHRIGEYESHLPMIIEWVKKWR